MQLDHYSSHRLIYLSAVDSVAACLAQPVEALQCDYAYSYFWMTQVFFYILLLIMSALGLGLGIGLGLGLFLT